MPERIRIYFVDNHMMEIEREKAAFTNGVGFFDLIGAREGLTMDYADIVRDGRALVNWDNVCFVKEISGETEEEYLL